MSTSAGCTRSMIAFGMVEMTFSENGRNWCGVASRAALPRHELTCRCEYLDRGPTFWSSRAATHMGHVQAWEASQTCLHGRGRINDLPIIPHEDVPVDDSFPRRGFWSAEPAVPHHRWIGTHS